MNDDYSSSSFWKGSLPPYRETMDNDDNSIDSPDSFHSIEDNGDRDGDLNVGIPERKTIPVSMRNGFVIH